MTWSCKLDWLNTGMKKWQLPDPQESWHQVGSACFDGRHLSFNPETHCFCYVQPMEEGSASLNGTSGMGGGENDNLRLQPSRRGKQGLLVFAFTTQLFINTVLGPERVFAISTGLRHWSP